MYTDSFTRICRGDQTQQIIGAFVHASDAESANTAYKAISKEVGIAGFKVSVHTPGTSDQKIPGSGSTIRLASVRWSSAPSEPS